MSTQPNQSLNPIEITLRIPEVACLILEHGLTIDELWSLRTVNIALQYSVDVFLKNFWRDIFIRYYGENQVKTMGNEIDYFKLLKEKFTRPKLVARKFEECRFEWDKQFFEKFEEDCLKVAVIETLMLATSAITSSYHIVEYSPVSKEIIYVEKEKLAFCVFYGLNCSYLYFCGKGKDINQDIDRKYVEYRSGNIDSRSEIFKNLKEKPFGWESYREVLELDIGPTYCTADENDFDSYENDSEVEKRYTKGDYQGIISLSSDMDADLFGYSIYKEKPRNCLIFDFKNFDIRFSGPKYLYNNTSRIDVLFPKLSPEFKHASHSWEGDVLVNDWKIEKFHGAKSFSSMDITLKKDDSRMFIITRYEIIDIL